MGAVLRTSGRSGDSRIAIFMLRLEDAIATAFAVRTFRRADIVCIVGVEVTVVTLLTMQRIDDPITALRRFKGTS